MSRRLRRDLRQKYIVRPRWRLASWIAGEPVESVMFPDAKTTLVIRHEIDGQLVRMGFRPISYSVDRTNDLNFKRFGDGPFYSPPFRRTTIYAECEE